MTIDKERVIMRQIFEFYKPSGFTVFWSSIISPTEGTMTIECQPNKFTFTLIRDFSTLIKYTEKDDYVEIIGRKIPIECSSWKKWPLFFILNGKYYTHKFNKLYLFKYKLHNSIVCDGKEIADIYYTINSQLLFFKTGGRIRMELDNGIPFLEPLFYCIAWWWTGYFIDDTSS